jgi:hypothetical protein
MFSWKKPSCAGCLQAMSRKNRNQPEAGRRNRRIIYAVLATIIILIATVYFYSASLTKSTPPKAAIIDQLGSASLGAGIREVNQTFIEIAMNMLHQRFNTVDYYSDNATVGQYATLASSGYRMILWRGHSALDLNGKYIALSTTEKYGFVNYDDYLNSGRLTLCNITGDPNLYFGITPTFITQVMNGRFQDTVIFLMSCNGLNPGYLKTAQAFEDKGARVIISWDNWVSSFENDGAAELLLQHLINENDTIAQAVGKIPPYFSSDLGVWTQLKYSPENPAASNYLIPDYRQTENSLTNATVTVRTLNKCGKLGLETE